MAEKSKIYTRTGDKGTTSLVGGSRVPKYHDKVEAYGSVDELTAFIGVLMDQPKMFPGVKDALVRIQNCLFTIESDFAVEPDTEIRKMMPSLDIEEVYFLEDEMDKMNETIPPMRAFVIPGGNILSSHCHVCRTVCRRAERRAWKLAEHENVNDMNMKYLNRLSDYFFVLARFFFFSEKSDENIWNSTK